MTSLSNVAKVEKNRLYNYLRTNIATVTMASKDTGINQKNIRAYKREFEKEHRLFLLGRWRCKITGQKAQYLTTSVDVWRAFEQKKSR